MSDAGRCDRCGGWIWECRREVALCLKTLRERNDDLEYRLSRLEARMGGTASAAVPRR
jgi:BMFP domain-containing protein YqiC